MIAEKSPAVGDGGALEFVGPTKTNSKRNSPNFNNFQASRLDLSPGARAPRRRAGVDRQVAAMTPLAVAGEFDCQAYKTDAGEDRLSWSIMVDAVLSARAKHKPKAEQRPDRGVADGPWART